MKMKFTILIIIFLQLFTAGLLHAEDIHIQGTWQVVELEPSGNPINLKEIDAYSIFLPNGTLIEAQIPKDNKLPTEMNVYKYKYENGILTRIDKKEINKHKIAQIGLRLKMSVPFGGYVWLQKIP